MAEEGRTICIMKTEQRAEEIGTEGCGRKGKGDMYNRNGTGAEKIGRSEQEGVDRCYLCYHVIATEGGGWSRERGRNG